MAVPAVSIPTRSLNQSPPFEDVDLFARDPAAAGRGARPTAPAATPRRCRPSGGAGAAAEMFELGAAGQRKSAEAAGPSTPQGFRRDVVEFHPAYHPFMARERRRRGCMPRPGAADGKPGAGAGPGRARGALLHGGAGRDRARLPDHHDARGGGGARGGARARRASSAARSRRANTTRRFRPWSEKKGITLGMGMTEKQGGTDVRANTTRAVPRRRRLPHHRPQMVHVGADVRRLPGAGAGAGRAHLLSDAALPARRHASTGCGSSG